MYDGKQCPWFSIVAGLTTKQIALECGCIHYHSQRLFLRKTEGKDGAHKCPTTTSNTSARKQQALFQKDRREQQPCGCLWVGTNQERLRQRGDTARDRKRGRKSKHAKCSKSSTSAGAYERKQEGERGGFLCNDNKQASIWGYPLVQIRHTYTLTLVKSTG